MNFKNIIFSLLLFIFGILTGRNLPQWVDMANSPYKYGAEIMFLIMYVMALILVFLYHKFEIRD